MLGQFPIASEPLEVGRACRQRGEQKTGANYVIEHPMLCERDFGVCFIFLIKISRLKELN